MGVPKFGTTPIYMHTYTKGAFLIVSKDWGILHWGLKSGKTSPGRSVVLPAMAADALDAAGPEVEALGPSLRVHVGVLSGFFVIFDSLFRVCTSVMHWICVTYVAYLGLSYDMQTGRLAASLFDDTTRVLWDAIPWHAGQPRKDVWRCVFLYDGFMIGYEQVVVLMRDRFDGIAPTPDCGVFIVMHTHVKYSLLVNLGWASYPVGPNHV